MPSVHEYGKDLTEREVEVLNAFCRSGFTAKTVGLALGISHRTVEVHMSRAIAKIGAENQLHALLMWDRATRGVGASAEGTHICTCKQYPHAPTCGAEGQQP